MKITDYTKDYSNLVTFDPNKNLAVHKWYLLVEGYSSDLVKSIINEQVVKPKVCFDPFGGVGTTALTCKELGIETISIEASPFFYDVTKAKLNFSNYDAEILELLILNLRRSLMKSVGMPKHPELESKTFFENSKKSKWIFHQSVSNAIFDITKGIEKTCKDHQEYKSLFTIALACILQDVSNVFKNGKCLSYKKKWKEKVYSRMEVHNLFLKQIESSILPDLKNFQNLDNKTKFELLNGDSREKIKDVNTGIDLVITSPPYLNSRDYTDIYRLELWMLGYVSSYEKERTFRKRALTSHVQIPLPKVDFPQVEELKKAVEFLEGSDATLWNKNIPNMVRGYFNDIQNLLLDLKPKLNDNAKLYINVSNSCYSNYIIEVDVIIAKAAELIGYECEEIRIARPIRTSSQQNLILNSLDKMRESIIVLKLK
ncbi:DNA methyltransferase [Flavobacterium flavigenum]|uniref:DNA methyltransferase n=1 Tax=Flavobacterium flavigenum TaxID=3003258 RepID=UPI00248239A5|nr:DNA methyltransferase [Flavobacterium flavigenum]